MHVTITSLYIIKSIHLSALIILSAELSSWIIEVLLLSFLSGLDQ